MASGTELDTLSAVRQQLEGVGFVVFGSESDDLPTLVAASQDRGLVAVDLTRQSEGAVVELNRKIARLRSDLPGLGRVATHRLVVAEDIDSSDGQFASVADAVAGRFIPSIPARPLADGAMRALDHFFAARLSIVVPRRVPMTDRDSADRAEERLALDAAQIDIATRNVEDVMLISGPPGSGKTLVLAARAKWLAALHPDWRIVLLCYNRLLVPYLEQLVWGHANIDVHTFGQFTSRLRVRVSLENEEWATRNVALALASLRPTYDAVLIDEWQDFMGPWMKLALATVKPGRGGLTLAGDPKQALYRDSDPKAALAGHTIDTVTLDRPYRSTRQILEVTSALDESMDVTGRSGALEGKAVDLVWAENVAEIGAAIGRDIQLLVEHEERRPQDVGVLVTRRWDIPKVVFAIESAGVPVVAVYANKADQFDLSDPTVKVMTVHSAKGYEFDVVFLVGMEHIANPDGSERAEREGRCGFVGFTRAKDQLVLTYSRENVYLDRIRALPTELVQQWVWPDDYPELD